MTTTTRLFVTKWCLVFLASAVGWSATAFAAAAPSHKLNEGTSAQPADIEVFVREGCPHCRPGVPGSARRKPDCNDYAMCQGPAAPEH